MSTVGVPGQAGSGDAASSNIRVAVIGHVEWVEFARVDHVPAPGEIVHATETWEEPAGGGAVAAVQLLRLAGPDRTVFFTALGDDAFGRRAAEELGRLGLRVEAAFRPGIPQRRVLTFVDANGERTITTLGPRLGPSVHDPLPWDELADVDAAYFCAGDRGALAQGRRARVLVATAREMDLLAGAGVRLDVVAGSAIDPGERYPPDGIDPAPGAVVRTEGPRGGTYVTADGRQGRWEPALVPASPPGVLPDAYGCGDSFTGGLTFGLGTGMPLDQALALAARCGAACRAGRGAYGAQLALA